jgi:hypothetical protein
MQIRAGVQWYLSSVQKRGAEGGALIRSAVSSVSKTLSGAKNTVSTPPRRPDCTLRKAPDKAGVTTQILMALSAGGKPGGAKMQAAAGQKNDAAQQPTSLQHPAVVESSTPVFSNNTLVFFGAGAGSSSLINVLSARKDTDANAFRVSEEHPGHQWLSSAANTADGSYLEAPSKIVDPAMVAAQLKAADAFAVVCIADRLLETTSELVPELRKQGVPFVLVRTKAEMAITQMQRRQPSMPASEAFSAMKQQFVADALGKEGMQGIAPEQFFAVSAWEMAEPDKFSTVLSHDQQRFAECMQAYLSRS